MKKNRERKGTCKRVTMDTLAADLWATGYHAHADRQSRQTQITWTPAASRTWTTCMHAQVQRRRPAMQYGNGYLYISYDSTH